MKHIRINVFNSIRISIPNETTYYTITLNFEEAQVLRDILGSVGGSAITSRRKYVDNIRISKWYLQ